MTARQVRAAVALVALGITVFGSCAASAVSMSTGDVKLAIVGSTTAATTTLAPPPPVSTGLRRNIVFVLTDDLSENLVPYMPHVEAMMAQGMSFTNYTVTNSLCCPSRASIFTGEFPHNTGVQSNDAPYGGYAGFERNNDETHTFATALKKAGYLTGFMGKYFNGYDPHKYPANPPGWTTWAGVDGGGYRGYNYNLSINGAYIHHDWQPSDYMTTVLDGLANKFVENSAAAGRPFALEVAPFTPHFPYSVAPEDTNSFQTLQVPRTPAFNTHPTNAPDWLSNRGPLTPDEIAKDDNAFRLRVEGVQSVDRMIAHLQETLAAVHQLSNTVFIFSSDNGYHMSEYGLTAGKLTAFDTDVKVPLVVVGPGITPGSVNADPVENIDLAPTFEQLGGSPIPARVDGHSFVPLLYGRNVAWRTLSGVEHGSVVRDPSDPDIQPFSAGVMGIYYAVRSATFTYVEYNDGEHEYYDRTSDPYMLDNVYDQLSDQRKAELSAEVAGLKTCKGYTQCWQAGQPTG